MHVTSGENDRGRYPREGKGLVRSRTLPDIELNGN